MAAAKAIKRISELLNDTGLSWLVPNLRQDFVVWNAINDSTLADAVIHLHTSKTEFKPQDFSPSKLASLASGLGSYSEINLGQSLDSIEGQLSPPATNSQYLSLLSAALQELASAGSIALNWLDHFTKTNNWSRLVKDIQENPHQRWESVIACLYGLIEEPIDLVRTLTLPGGSTFLSELAVHAVLSNPFTDGEQLSILINLCHDLHGDPVPPASRLAIFSALSQQRPQMAVDFSSKWIHIDSNNLQRDHKESENFIELTNQLVENLFQEEIMQCSNESTGLHDSIEDGLGISRDLYNTFISRSLDQKSRRDNTTIDRRDIRAISDHAIQLNGLIHPKARIQPGQAELAIALANQGLYEEANQLLPSAMDSMSDDVFALYAIAKVAYLRGDPEKSWEAISKVVKTLDYKSTAYKVVSRGDGWSLTNLAELLVGLHKNIEAARVLELGLARNPNDTNLLEMLADSYRASYQTAKVADILSTLVSLKPNFLGYRRAYAKSLEELDKWQESLRERSFIIGTFQGEDHQVSQSDKYDFIHCATQANEPGLALTVCKELLQENPDDCQALIYSGKAHILKGDIDGGMDYLNQAIQVAPQAPEAWIALVETQKDVQSPEVVIDTLKKALLAIPNSGEIHHMLGEAYVQKNDLTVALQEFRIAVDLSNDNVQFLKSYGNALMLSGQNNLSREVYEKAYHLQPDFPGLAHNYANLLVEMGKLEEAILPLETLINLQTCPDPELNLEYARCVLILDKQGSSSISPMKALIALNQVLQLNPDHAEAKALTAEALAANGDKELAFQAYREALDSPLVQDRDWFERLSFGFGCVANAIGKPDIAIAALQEASQVNSDNPEIFIALTDAYKAANLLEEAIRSARNVLAIDGENPDNLAWFAKQIIAYGSDVKTEHYNSNISISEDLATEAVSALMKAIQLAPTRADLLVQLGFLQESIGERSAAQATLKSIVTLDFASIADLMGAAKYLSEIGDHTSAIDCLEKGTVVDQCQEGKHNANLYTSLAQEYLNNNSHASAINTLDDAIRILPSDNSLIVMKVGLLLEGGRPQEALQVIDARIQENNQPVEDLLFLASLIHRTLGNFLAAVQYARLGASIPIPGSTDDQIAHIGLVHRVQLAEIYRALLQPGVAYRILQSNDEINPEDFTDEQYYLDYVFLETELALVTGGGIRPNIQDIKLEASHPSFSRCLAINSRLMNKAGNYKQAEQLFKLAVSKLDQKDQDASIRSWFEPYSTYLTLISLIEAAQELGLWDHALAFIEQSSKFASDEPLTQLNICKTLVLEAEFSHLCERFEVSNHKPSNHLQGFDAFERCQLSLDNAKNLLAKVHCDEKSADNAITDQLIYRWRARADITFNPASEPKVDPGEILADQATPEEIVWLIQNLHSGMMSDSTDLDLAKITKLGRAFPRNPLVILHVALALQDSDPEGAKRSLESVLEHNPCARNPTIAFCNVLLARIGLYLGEIDCAKEAIEKSIAIWPDEASWHWLASQIYLRINDFIQATQHLREAVRLAPSSLAYYLDLGRLLLENAAGDSNMLSEARISFEHVLEMDTNNIIATLKLVETYYHLNDIDKAEALGRSALSLAPDRPDLYQLLNKVAIGKNDYQSAYEYANKAIQINPGDAQSTVCLVKSLTAMGRHAEALAKLNTVIPMVPDPKALHLEKVNIIRNVSGPQIALNELKSLTRIYPDDFTLLATLSKLFYEVGELENAVGIARQALNVQADSANPNEQANLHLLIGQACRQTGKLDQSIQHLNDAIRLAPNRLEPYLELGLACKEQQEYQQALQMFERATLLAPDDPRALFQAGLALKESKDYKSSELMLRRAVTLAPNDLMIRRQLAAVVALNLIHNPRFSRNAVK